MISDLIQLAQSDGAYENTGHPNRAYVHESLRIKKDEFLGELEFILSALELETLSAPRGVGQDKTFQAIAWLRGEIKELKE
jgi:hypothetical protein